jgi:hypothetical protein
MTEAFALIETTLRGNWTLTPLVFENEGFELPDQPAHFVYVEVWGESYRQESLGAETRDANLWRESGQLMMHVMVPDGIGTSLARQYAKQLVGLFRGQDIDETTFRDASIGAGEAGRDFGNYWALTAAVNWERDE